MIIKFLYKVVLIFMICMGAHAWFVWDIEVLNKLPQVIIWFVIFIISFIYKQTNKITFRKPALLYSIALTFVIAGVFPISDLISIAVGMLIRVFSIFPILVLLCDNKNALSHLSFVSKTLAFLFIPGLIIWFITSFMVTIPGIPIVYPNDNDTYIFYNYIFSLKNIYWDYEFNRFMSVFLEPGYLGTLLAFLLFANRFDLSKWYNIVLLLGLLASFSLAGYVMAFTGYLFLRIQDKRIGVLIVFSLLLIVLYWVGVEYHNGDNVINHAIIERLEYDEDKGIAGNDRFHADTDYLYTKYASTGGLLFGNVGALKELDIRGAGYKIFFLCYGIVAGIFYFFFYCLVVKYTNTKSFGLFFLVLVIMCFVQAGYPNSFLSILPYVLGLNASSSALVMQK